MFSSSSFLPPSPLLLNTWSATSKASSRSIMGAHDCWPFPSFYGGNSANFPNCFKKCFCWSKKIAIVLKYEPWKRITYVHGFLKWDKAKHSIEKEKIDEKQREPFWKNTEINYVLTYWARTISYIHTLSGTFHIICNWMWLSQSVVPIWWYTLAVYLNTVPLLNRTPSPYKSCCLKIQNSVFTSWLKFEISLKNVEIKKEKQNYQFDKNFPQHNSFSMSSY